MNEIKLADKMEQAVSSYREQLEKKDDSRLACIGIAAKLSVEAIKSFFYGSECTQQSLEKFRASSENFEQAMREHDPRSAKLALSRMEREVENIRSRTV